MTTSVSCTAWPAKAIRRRLALKTSSRVSRPITAPTTVTVWPPILRGAENMKAAPWPGLDPVLMPSTPPCPNEASTLKTRPATGSVASGWATISASTGLATAASARRVRSVGVETDCSEAPLVSA